MYDTGRVCVKIAGRDAGKRCVVLKKVSDSKIIVDGETRRREVNIKHVEPLDSVVDLEEGASHEDVLKAVSTLDWDVRNTKPKQAGQRPKSKRREAGEKVSKITRGQKDDKITKPKSVMKDSKVVADASAKKE